MKNVLVTIPREFLFLGISEIKLPLPADWLGEIVNLPLAQVSSSCVPAIWNQIIPNMLNVNASCGSLSCISH